MSDVLVTVEKLTFDYGRKRALDNIDLTIARGGISAMVGPNGAGKTTLLRCIAALDQPVSGKVVFGGVDTQDDPRNCHARIGYLSDFFGLYRKLSVEQSLAFVGYSHRLTQDVLTQRVNHAISSLNLESHRHSTAAGLSRGLRQRLAIGMAIIHRPELLILDEPAAGLDPDARSELAALLRALAAEGISIIVSSHILSELEEYSDRMITIAAGRCAGIVELDSNKRADEKRRFLATGDFSYQGVLAALSGHVTGEYVSEVVGGVRIELTSSIDEADVLAVLVRGGIRVRSYTRETRTIEDLYRQHVHGDKPKK